MKLFKWRGRISKPEFRKRFIEATKADAPHLQVRESDKDVLDVIIEGLEIDGNVIVSLHRAYAEFEKKPEACDEILQRWVKSQQCFVRPRAVARGNIVPMLKAREYLRQYHALYDEPVAIGSSRDLLYDDYNEELIAVYVEKTEGAIHFLDVSQLATLGLTREELSKLAYRNLSASTTKREILSTAGVRMVSVGGNFEATMLLDDDIWLDRNLTDLDPLIVAVPDRNSLMAATDASAASIWHFAYMARGLAVHEQYPITSKLFVRCGSRFELLDPDDSDEAHAIPNIDVIDVYTVKKTGGATLAIVIASLLDASPRSVFRLFRKLDGYLNFIGSDSFRKECGAPTLDNTEIELRCHWHPHADLLAIMETIGGYVESRGARLALGLGEAET
ncbi:MAG: hypothetical protein H7Y89_12800 [Steroidobacteraceae bacterium]|nr:hypothetical protein [Steroidobacteraceae bacterium]